MSMEKWKSAPPPNYKTNVDKKFPYSEVNYIGDFNLIKIPLPPNNYIEHVDYWGEGRIDSNKKKGFTNCYNVNEEYQLVTDGEDKNRKIPNRIPINSNCGCDTKGYINENTVITVTVSGKAISLNCAEDIARIVNNKMGKVIAFGYNENSQDFKYLTEQLRQKELLYCPSYTLPAEFQGLTFDKQIAFLNLTTATTEFPKSITNGTYDDAVKQTKNLKIENNCDFLKEQVWKLIESSPRNVMTYAYKLWNSGAQDYVKNCFPTSFSLILNEENVKIVNKKYNQALKLDWNSTAKDTVSGWGDVRDKTSNAVSWKFKPVWYPPNVIFQLFNVDRKLNLQLGVDSDGMGDKRAWGSQFKEDSDINTKNRFRYYLEPKMLKGDLCFGIINFEYVYTLKLAVKAHSGGDRPLWGHKGHFNKNDLRFNWNILAF